MNRASPVRQEVASKNDGQIDTWYFYNAAGEIERRGQDPSRSGKATVWIYYQNGQAVRSEEDSKSNWQVQPHGPFARWPDQPRR